MAEEKKSNNELKNFTDDLLLNKILQCASCEDVLNSPVKMVDGVGDVCNDCYQTKYSNQATISFINSKIDYIISKLEIPCKFTSEGCSEILPHAKYLLHVKDCMYQAKPCPIKSCIWQDNNFKINEHFKECHADNVIKIDSDMFSVICKENQKELINLIIINDESLMLKLKIDSGKLFYMLCTTNKTQKHTKYSVEIDTVVGRVSNNSKLCSYNNIYGSVSPDNGLNLLELLCTSEIKVTFILKNTNISGKGLTEYLECQVCKTLMRPPIHNCEMGHSICGACKTRVTQCPSCRSSYSSNSKNYSLEGICKYVEYSCKYDDKGCVQKGFLNEIIQHEEVCSLKDK
ncbi:unnamed protein product [Brassicogethes aeneus]|uniref:RING-type E3 ubiquitin transferase n=1 Tax=Brassicogethes aeneus TaxID=1431903 RepID=A0A9P0AYQ5_BRAAE|nr:unnamed protein product [Brassicogethes aeneus]